MTDEKIDKFFHVTGVVVWGLVILWCLGWGVIGVAIITHFL